MYRVHEEMVTYQTNGQTFADFCFKWATPTQPSVQLPIKIVQTMDHNEMCIFNQAQINIMSQQLENSTILTIFRFSILCCLTWI